MDELTDVTEAIETLESAVVRGPDPITRDDVLVTIPDADISEFQEAWDRQPDEKDWHWVAFEHYRDSGVGRSIPETHRWFIARGGVPEKTEALLVTFYKASSRHRWAERVQKWDTYQERLYQIARGEAVREMVARHEGQIEEALEGLMAPIRALNHRMEEDPDFMDTLSKGSINKLIGLANSAARTMPNLMSAERLARGMPTEVIGGTVDVNHVVKVERDHIGEVLDVLAGAGVLDGRGHGLSVGPVIDAEVVDDDPVSPEDLDEL